MDSLVRPQEAPEAHEILAFRRERRRLAWLNRMFLLVGLGFIGWVLWAVIIAGRHDAFYILPSLFGTLTGVSRYLVHRVRVLPVLVRDLRHRDPVIADRAYALVDAHRAELLGATDVPRTIHEPPLAELPREALVERIARAGDTDWRRVLRTWLWIWGPLCVAVFLATLLVSPEQPFR